MIRHLSLVLLLVAACVTSFTAGCSGADAGDLFLADGGDIPDANALADAGGDDGASADGSTVDGAADAADGATDGGTDGAADASLRSLSINSVAAGEGNSGSTAMTFTVTLSAASTQTLTVDFATSDGDATVSSTAVGGADYVASSGTVTFAPGDTTKTINVFARGDATAEANETFKVTLSNPTSASIAQAVGTGTINNDDALPSISIGNALVTEGNTGTTPANFNVTLSAPSGQTVTVHAKTTDGAGGSGATAANSDYTAIADTTVTFAPGQTVKTVTVDVIGDATVEPNETFTVDLSAPTNATLGTASGTGTIQNNDGAVQPTISITDPTLAEGSSLTTTMTFTVTLSMSSAQTVTVDFKTTDGTASATGTAAAGGLDYVAASNTLTFAPGVTTQNVSITINGDAVHENDEAFTVDLSNATNATVSKVQGTGTITNDDVAPTVTIASSSIDEGQAGTKPLTFTLSLSAPSGKTVSVSYATADGTATAGGSLSTGGLDYVASSGTIDFPPGTTAQTVSVNLNGDALNEASETFNVTISAPVNASIGASATGIGTIDNDDPLPQVVIDDVSLVEGNTGTSAMMFTVALVDGSLAPVSSGRAVSVAYATAGGSATSGTDFLAASGTVDFAAGQTTQVVTVQINGDAAPEANETLAVNLSSPVNASIADATGAGTITNDDGTLPFLNVADTSVTEGNAGTATMTFTVSLSAAATADVTVAYATGDDTATSGGTLASGGQDYVPTSGTLTFTPGQISKTVTVTVNGDVANEEDDGLVLVLTLPSANAALQDDTGIGTITNDDAVPSVSIDNVTSAEGNSGTTTASFTVTLSAVSGQAVSVSYATNDDTAQVGGLVASGGQDYQAASGTVIFAPGETTKTVSVAINGDGTHEANENYSVTLSAPLRASLGTATGVGTITNDDTPPTIVIDDVSVSEAQPSATFTVTLSRTSQSTVTVNFATQNGTAIGGFGPTGDYTTTFDTLTIAPGATSGTITVTIRQDTTVELDETFSVNLSNPLQATILDGSGVGTITDDD